jgi:hypothetical protein
MTWSQIFGFAVLILMGLLGFWLMSAGRKVKPTGEGPGEGTHGIVSEVYRQSGNPRGD